MMATKKKTAAPVEEQPQAVETAQEAPQTAQETQEQPQDVQVGVDLADPAVDSISAENVVVLSDRGLDYPVEEVLKDGTLLAVLALPHGAEVPGWALVHTGQRTGWVDRRFIRALEPAQEA